MMASLYPALPDDVEFVNTLKEEHILVVPGSGFNGPGYFRIAFCVDDNTIKNSLPGFGRAIGRYKSDLGKGLRAKGIGPQRLNYFYARRLGKIC